MLSTLMMDAIPSCETSHIKRSIRRDIPEDGIFYELLLPTNVSSLWIVFTLMIEAICPSVTSVLPRAIQRHIPEEGILHIHRRENLT
jgi:hypothetical protein